MTNKHYWIFIVFLCSIGAQGLAQQNKKNTSSTLDRGWQFHSINQAGLLEGQIGSAFQIQTINGLQYRSWFAGIGAGIDYYRFRGIPLFIDLRKEFGHSGNKFYIYMGTGMHFIWLTDKQKNEFNLNHFGSNDFSNGLYAGAGVGYKVELNNQLAIFISPGFIYKKTEVKNSNTICPFQGPCYIISDRYNFDLYRLSVNVGIVF